MRYEHKLHKINIMFKILQNNLNLNGTQNQTLYKSR